MDKSNGYENIALEFMKVRENPNNKIGVSTVKSWAASLPEFAKVLDLGCGSGIPVSKTLIDQGLTVYGIDASPTLALQFKEHFPDYEIRCESVEASSFFDLEFDGIIAWGLVFLLAPKMQVALLEKIADRLKRAGKLLFTSPSQKARWMDMMTGLPSASLGAKKYREVLERNGLVLFDCYFDEGENYYYSCIKA